MTLITIFLYISSSCFLEYDAAKILGFSMIPSTSHQGFLNAFWKELSLRGHQVTAITSMPLQDPNLTNLTEIDVSSTCEMYINSNVPKYFSKSNYVWNIFTFIRNMLEDLLDAIMANNGVKELLQSDAEFDVVIVEAFNAFGFAFGERFKAPVIGLVSCLTFLEIYDIYGNPTHPLIFIDTLMPVETSPKDHPFTVRFKSFLFNIWSRMLYYLYYLPRIDQLVKKHFGKQFPPLKDIIRSQSSILLNNVNLVTNPIRANVPSVIDISQIHLRANRSLPKDLQDFLDSSTQGAVYFSLGSTVPCSTLNNRTINEIVDAFSELPFNVLWKWEKDTIPTVSPNVLVRKFFPQQDLLAHPNIRVFVTQGGLQSIEEAIFNEVPMVGIPIIADQPMNVKSIVELGIAERLDYTKITRDSLVEAIQTVAGNPRYKNRVKEYKFILQDEPLKGIDKAIWWIEYVIRHKGAKHLKSPVAEMSFFQYFLLDVVAVLFITFSILCYSVYKTIHFIKTTLKRKPKMD